MSPSTPSPDAAAPRAVASPGWVADRFPDWLEPVDPFRIVGPVHYVGTAGIGAYLITSSEGHILLDGGLPENADVILASIRALGFDPADVRLLLNSHAHFDHAGGLAALRSATGAPLAASAADRPALESGRHEGTDPAEPPIMPPVLVDRVVADGEVLTVGELQLTAHITAGHTEGCTSYTLTVEEAGDPLDVLLFCSATVAANRLVAPPTYPGIVDAYRATFDRTRDWRPHVFLANHPFFTNLFETREALVQGGEASYVDVAAFPAFIQEMEAAFERALVKQQADAG